MTIEGWVLFVFFALIIGAFAVGAFMMFDSVDAKSVSVIVGVILIFALLFGMFWFLTIPQADKEHCWIKKAISTTALNAQ